VLITSNIVLAVTLTNLRKFLEVWECVEIFRRMRVSEPLKQSVCDDTNSCIAEKP